MGTHVYRRCLLPEELSLWRYAALCYHHLMSQERGREEILRNGGIKTAMNALWKNQHHTELVELSLNLFFDLSFSGMQSFAPAMPNLFRRD